MTFDTLDAGQTSKLKDKAAERAYRFADLSRYALKQRALIRAADIVFYLLIKFIGRTVKFEVEGRENWDAAMRDGNGAPIHAFWHNRVFLGTYFFRGRGIVIMTSQSFDGEYIARFIQRFGFGAARGSSTRGGIGALVEMIRLVRAGKPTGFSLDGPKGPVYQVKPGALLLAKKTGAPLLPFCLTAQKFWMVKSWDKFQIPKPFTRALVNFAPPLYVAPDADEAAVAEKQSELQNTLDRLTARGDAWRADASVK